MIADVRRYGSRALLVAPGGGGVAPTVLAELIRALRLTVVEEVVPAAESVLIVVATRDEVKVVEAALSQLDSRAAATPEPVAGRDIVIDVVYEGPDLDSVAAASGLSVDAVIARHATPVYESAFCGFSPGFAYLTSLDAALQLPRRATPRTSVPVRSVAIAGPFTAVYPTASPGGWHLLGHTDAELWNPDADPPALLAPGTRVRFRRVRAPRIPEVTPTKESPAPISSRPAGHRARRRSAAAGAALKVVAAGIATSIQDQGRIGLAHLAVPSAGALDRHRAALVNRLAGNADGAAVFETAGGLVLEALTPLTVADSTSGGVRTLAAGERIAVDPPAGELWAYLAVRGGIDVDPVLGSRSWDSLAGLGPRPPRRDDIVAVGSDPGTTLTTDLAPPAPAAGAVTARVLAGPHTDWFTPVAHERLVTTPWSVSDDVSRVGLRLLGPPLERGATHARRELPSEGLVAGAVQVPPDGHPVVMLNDHPTTGGYPVIAVVDEADLAALAQSRPGTAVTLRRVRGK